MLIFSIVNLEFTNHLLKISNNKCFNIINAEFFPGVKLFKKLEMYVTVYSKVISKLQ